MKIYHSFFPSISFKYRQELHKLHEMSVLSALSSYGNINLLTNEEGFEFLKNLPYTSFDFFDKFVLNSNIQTSNLLNEYNHIWALNKILAYEKIARKGQQFMHIDYDVFLFKKLPDFIHTAEVFCQSQESDFLLDNYYEIDLFESNCPNKLFYDNSLKTAYNVGIIGGTNCDFFKFYTQECIRLLLDGGNDEYWKNLPYLMKNKYKTSNPKDIPSYETAPSCSIEQFWLSQCLKFHNIKPTLLFEDNDYVAWDSFIQKNEHLFQLYKYTHLFGGTKWDPNILKKIDSKIKELKYILSIT
jgi:hypothetical protein